MKKIGFLMVIILNIFYIYKITEDRKIYFLALGDYAAVGVNDNNRINGGYNDYIKNYLKDIDRLETFNNSFATINYRTTDLINDISNNKEISINNKNVTIQNALIKADLVTLSIGNNDIIFEIQSSVSDDFVDDIMNDLDSLFNLIRKYTKETVIVNSFYYPFGTKVDNIDKKILYANQKLNILCDKYDFIYNDVYSLLNNNTNINSIYPTQSNYKAIASKIIEEVGVKYVNN